MRFGFFFWPYTPEYTARMARLGEEYGFDLVGIADTPGNAMDPWVAMTLAAAATSRVTLATCVTNLVTRHPSITASAAASVDLASGGRTILGVGAGHSGVANVGAAPADAESLREGVMFLRSALASEMQRGQLASSGARGRDLESSNEPMRRSVPVFVAASGPRALRVAGAAADGAFVNYGLGADHVRHARDSIDEGARGAGRSSADVECWSIACLDVSERREDALDTLGNILGFVAAYVVGPDPAGRGVPPELIPAVKELRAAYTTRRRDMDPALTRRLGLFDYLRARLAIAGTPADCVGQVRAAEAAGVTRLMFTVSLAADPIRTVELFGREVLPRFQSAGRGSP